MQTQQVEQHRNVRRAASASPSLERAIRRAYSCPGVAPHNETFRSLGIGIGLMGGAAASKTAGAGTTPLAIWGSHALQWVNGNLGSPTSVFWKDQTANGKDYTSVAGPTFGTDATLANQTTAIFNGTTQSMTSSLTLPLSGTTPTCLIAVFKLLALAAGNAIIFSDGNSQVNELTYQNSGTAFAYNGNVISRTAAPVNSWVRVRIDFSHSAGDIFKLGSTVAVTGDAGNAAATTNGRSICGFTSAICNVAVWELFYLNIIPTSGDVAAYDAGLSARAGGATIAI